MALSRHEEFRRAIRDLNVLASRDVAVLWRSVRDDAREVADALRDILPDLVEAYGSAAQSLAADYYEAVRDDLEVPGRFVAVVEDMGDTRTGSLVSWALGEARDGQSFASLVEGGLQARIANGARGVVRRSSLTDPRADGWLRIGLGECDFCMMLMSRGAVYSEESVDFAAHDHCNCQAAPAFDESQARAVREEFVPSARRRSRAIRDADRERVNAWIGDNL